MSGLTDIVIVGAGPNGLSIAAHLRQRGIDYRVFGTAMSRTGWVDDSDVAVDVEQMNAFSWREPAAAQLA